MNMDPKNTNRFEFLFQRPDYVDELNLVPNIAIAKGAMASRMTQELRTRTIHPDGRRENVAEHGYMLAKVAVAIADELYPELDRGKIAIHAINHDDPEAYVGDTPTDVIAKHDPEAKADLEQLGVDRLVEEYAPITPNYVYDLVTYEEQDEPEAQFVRIVDKIMVLLIQIPNDGQTLRDHYTYDQYIGATHATHQKLLDQYPQFEELIELRTELAIYIANKYIRDWQADA